MTEKVNLRIEDFEDKKTKDGKRYSRFKTQEGWMSCFDHKVCETLKELPKDSEVCLEIAKSEPNEDGKVFSNIRGISQKGNTESQPASEKASSVAPKGNYSGNTTTMYVSYAKDIFCALIEKENANKLWDEMMKDAINLVKQAKTAFE
jgi:hypothetical protein